MCTHRHKRRPREKDGVPTETKSGQKKHPRGAPPSASNMGRRRDRVKETKGGGTKRYEERMWSKRAGWRDGHAAGGATERPYWLWSAFLAAGGARARGRGEGLFQPGQESFGARAGRRASSAMWTVWLATVVVGPNDKTPPFWDCWGGSWGLWGSLGLG